MRLIATVLLCFALLCLGAWAAYVYVPAPFEVSVAEVVRGSLTLTLDEEGEVRAIDRYVLSTPIDARVAPISLRVGDQVMPGTLLARMEPLPFSGPQREQHVARLKAASQRAEDANARVAKSKAELAQAQRTEEHVRGLVSQGLQAAPVHEQASRELAQATANARSAVFRAETAAADLRASEKALKLGEDMGRVLDLIAPVSGTVTRIFEPQGREAPAGTQLLTVSDPSRVEVVVPLLLHDAPKVRPGTPLLLQSWGGGDSLRLKVRRVDHTAFERTSLQGTQEYRVNVIADPPNMPLPPAEGYRITARIILSERQDVLKVPASAVFQHGQGWAVYELAGHQVKLREVTPGMRNETQVEITSGLTAGARVVVNPSSTLHDGARAVGVGRG